MAWTIRNILWDIVSDEPVIEVINSDTGASRFSGRYLDTIHDVAEDIDCKVIRDSLDGVGDDKDIN